MAGLRSKLQAQQYWAMSPSTEELIDRIQPERVSSLGSQQPWQLLLPWYMLF